MTYTINKTDGNELTKIPDGTFDTSSTSITLIGKNVTSFGEALNENFIKMLENFASTTAPENPIKGQVWFDTSNNRLNVYDGSSFRSSGGPQVSPRAPTSLVTGDLWINNDTNQLYFYDGTDLILAGPIWQNAQGETGFKVVTVIDTFGVSHTIAQLRVKSVILGIFSKDAFVPRSDFANDVANVTPVIVGFSAANVAGIKFDVTVTRSENILLDDGTPKSGSELVFTNEEAVFTEKVTIQNNAGLIIGGAEQVQQKIIDDEFIVEHQITDKPIRLKVKSLATTFSGISVLPVAPNQAHIGISKETPTVALDVNGDVHISGNLIVDGANTIINSTTLTVDDKNIVLADTSSPSNVAADGGGITLRGTTDKTIIYSNSSQSWDLSENLKLIASKTISIGAGQVLSDSALGTGVTSSNLQIVGVLESLQIKGQPGSSSGLNLLDGTISMVSGNIGLNPAAGSVDLNSTKIINLDDPRSGPQGLQDATTRTYVDDAIFSRPVSMSMDITGLANNNAIAAILNQIAPFYDPVGAPAGVAIDGTVLYLHTTSTTATNGEITISSSNFIETYANALSIDGSSTVTAIIDLNFSSVPGPTVNIGVARQNKRFIMGRSVSGQWGFDGDF